MRFSLAVLLWLAAGAAKAERILLVPLDSRPAAGQFAQMIGNMAGVDVVMPPQETLGRFTSPGSPEAILAWLQKQDYRDVTAVVVSTDMIAYGGLIASRIPDSSYNLAMGRLKAFKAFRESIPSIRFYGYSAIMRLSPTATRAAAPWRINLARYEEQKERYRRLGTASLFQGLKTLRAKIPDTEVQRYETTRDRDHQVQIQLIRMTAKGLFEYLILGQDDAQPYGPHIPETAELRNLVESLGIAGRTYFCEGIDQHSNILVSRALLRGAEWVPRIRVVYSDPLGRNLVAAYESKNVEQSLRDQIFASGARPTVDSDCDYTLFLNTPARSDDTFPAFLSELNSEVDEGLPVSVADIDLGKDGTGDPVLFQSLLRGGRMVKLLSYAGWNTAGNTMGTAIPAANVYLFSRRRNLNPLQREVAQREFLLHRFVNDFDYHKYTRPLAYRLIDSMPTANREETYGTDFDILNSFVRRDLYNRLDQTFKDEFLGKHFSAGGKEYEVSGLDDVRIGLPWPRVYEVRLHFKMETREVLANSGSNLR